MSDRAVTAIINRHARLMHDVWNRYLKKLEKGECYYYPMNEADMRCQLFTECLEEMRRKEFDKPYQIFAEDREIYEGKVADLAIGLREEGRAFLAVELKHHRKVEEIEEDIRKLHEAVKDKALWGVFLMLGLETYKYQVKLDLKALGIEEDGENSAFMWTKIKPKFREFPSEALFVSMRHSRPQ